MASAAGTDMINTFPVKKVSVPVDRNVVTENGTVTLTDNIVSEMRFEIPKVTLMKNDMAVLNVIAANNWKRPIYFTSPYEELGFASYLRKDGLSYRLVPVVGQQINTNWMTDKLMNKFAFGNANTRGVYFDEENRRHLNTIRTSFAELAMDLSSKGRKEEARAALDKVDKMMLQENMPYGMISRGNMHNRFSISFLEACYRSDHKSLAGKVLNAVKKDLQQQIKFYNSLSESKAELMAYDRKTAEDYLQALSSIEQMFSGKGQSPELRNNITPPGVPPPPADATGTDSGATTGL